MLLWGYWASRNCPMTRANLSGDLEPAIFRALVDLAEAIHQQVADKERVVRSFGVWRYEPLWLHYPSL